MSRIWLRVVAWVERFVELDGRMRDGKLGGWEATRKSVVMIGVSGGVARWPCECLLILLREPANAFVLGIAC